MSTSLLANDLTSRMTAATDGVDTTTHNFIPKASSHRGDHQGLHRDFNTRADPRHTEIVGAGHTLGGTKMRGYLEGRLAGKTATRLITRNLTH